ncbi:MAG TPA: VWA domain-containing protein [Bryobacteraceae bacterium]|jgi:VWFA-related protein
MRRLSSLALLSVITITSLLKAQEDIIHVETRLVVLYASVADKNGNLLTDLPRSAFKVYENNVEQQIKQFKREDIPVSLGILIDDSGSMMNKRQKVAAAALALVKASNPKDEVFIVNFNDQAYLDVPFTNNIDKLQEGLTRIESRGGTAMRDAISMSIDYMKKEAKLDKKVLLVITDGDDTASSENLEKLVAKCQRSEVLVYAIGLLTEEEQRRQKAAKRALQTLTTASGGVTFLPKDLTSVEQLSLQVAHEIRNQYLITYSPQIPDDGTFRTIKLVVSGRGNPTARTRTGYYATPEPPTKKVSQNHQH